jgi:hypothetical protein
LQPWFSFSDFPVFKQLAILANAAVLLILPPDYLSSYKAKIEKKKNDTDNGFKLPGGLIISGIAIGFHCLVA